MNLNSKKPEKRPLYVYYIIAVVIIVLLNVFALPALSERSVKETDYTTSSAVMTPPIPRMGIRTALCTW